MKRITITTIILISLFTASAFALSEQDAEAWREAAAAYQAAQYDKALRLYSALAENVENPGAKLLYNLGNVHYQLGQKGRAAWMYERAMNQSPRYGDARENLAVVRAETGAPDEAEAFFLWRPVEALYALLSAGEWAMAMAVVWLALGLFATMRILSPDGKRRRLSSLGTLVFACLFILAAGFAVPRIVSSDGGDVGVILQSNVPVRSGPTENSEQYFAAIEGERMAVEPSSIKGWISVKRLSDGRKGFVREDAVGII